MLDKPEYLEAAFACINYAAASPTLLANLVDWLDWWPNQKFPTAGESMSYHDDIPPRPEPILAECYREFLPGLTLWRDELQLRGPDSIYAKFKELGLE